MTTAIELPATVSQYAIAAGVSKTTVRRAIAAGTMKVDPEAEPTLIVGGDLAWTIERWKNEIAPHVADIKPHLRGWDGEGNLHVLVGTTDVTVERGIGEADLKRAMKELQIIKRSIRL